MTGGWLGKWRIIGLLDSELVQLKAIYKVQLAMLKENKNLSRFDILYFINFMTCQAMLVWILIIVNQHYIALIVQDIAHQTEIPSYL